MMTALQPLSRFSGLFAFSLGLIILVASWHASYGADQNKRKAKPEETASDLSPQSAEEVAQEILRIQADMGGSIVETSPVLNPSAPIPYIPPSPPAPAVSNSAVKKQVATLRNAAWQLDSTAHKLEMEDLYVQADTLRKLATSLRHDARQLRQAVYTD